METVAMDKWQLKVKSVSIVNPPSKLSLGSKSVIMAGQAAFEFFLRKTKQQLWSRRVR